MIFNPVAGQRDVEQDLKKAIAFLQEQGWEVTLRRTRGRGDGITYAREAAATGYDVAVAVGGDGTFGEVASGLVGTPCALGLLPVGTGNVWAHMVGLPIWTNTNQAALVDAARILVTGQRRPIDLGQAGSRYFVLWSGMGFDAEVARTVEPYREIRRSLGNVTYVVTALTQSLSMRGVRATVVVDGHAVRERVLMIIVTNAQLYGPSFRLAPQAQLDDGLLEVYVFGGINTLDVVRHWVNLMLGAHQVDSRVARYRARTIEIRGERPLPLHLDGDPAGYTPVTISVAPRAVEVILPEWSSRSLFATEGPSQEGDVSLAGRIVQYFIQQREFWRDEGGRLRTDLEKRLHPPASGDA